MELCSVRFHVSLTGSVELSTMLSRAELCEPYGAGSAFFLCCSRNLSLQSDLSQGRQLTGTSPKVCQSCVVSGP